MGPRLRRPATAVVGALVLLLVLVVGGAAEAEGRVAPDSAEVASRVGPPPVGTQSVAAAPVAPSPVPAAGWAWPLHPQPAVLARFDPPEVAWGSGHRGVDLAAWVGQEVLAPAAGTVTFSGVVVDRGVVVVTTASGLRTTFEPVEGAVSVGSAVSRGQVIGHVTHAPGHCSPAVCLHWGVLRGDAYLDPLAFLGPRRVVLLPLAPP